MVHNWDLLEWRPVYESIEKLQEQVDDIGGWTRWCWEDLEVGLVLESSSAMKVLILSRAMD